MYKDDFDQILDLIKSQQHDDLYDRCSNDMQDKYSGALINKYLKSTLGITGAMQSYKHEASTYDYDAEFEAVNSTIEYHTVFDKCEGNVTLALTSEDDDTEITDFYFDLDDIFEIKSINKAVKDLFKLLEKKEYKKAYEGASDNFKRLNYDNFFEALLTDIPNISFDKLEFTDAVLKLQEDSNNVLLEIGYSLPNYAGVVINFNILEDEKYQLESFEYIDP